MNDMSGAPKIWAYKGEAVTCVNGHTVCSIARDLYQGDPRANDGSDFEQWLQPQPAREDSVADIVCKKCRGRWLGGNPKDGYRFHFGAPPNGSWR